MRQIEHEEFTKNSSIMFVASLIAGLLNYFYQIFMGGKLGPAEYGEFGALFAIFYIISVLSITISTSSARFVSKFIGEGKQIGFFIKGSLKHMSILGILFSIIFLLLSPIILKILRISDYRTLLVLIIIIFMAFISPILEGCLRGLKQFSFLGITGISNALFKLILGAILVISGYGVIGAFFGVFFGMLIGSILGLLFLKPFIKPNNPHEPEFKFSSFYGYSGLVIFAMLGMSIPGNLDVIIVRMFFSEFDTGIYTSVSVLGKIIFFISAAIYTVMFPIVTEKFIRGEQTFDILKKSIIYTSFLSGSVVLVYVLLPETILRIFGDKYISALPLIAPYSLAMFFFSLNTILINYYLATNNRRNVFIFLILSMVEILLLITYHFSLYQIIRNLLLINIIILVFFILSLSEKKFKIEIKSKTKTDKIE